MTGEEAITLAQEHAPDVILMDIRLPGMDGTTAVQLLKSEERTATIPVVALTAHAMTGDRDLALNAGCAGYIAKPIDTRTFGAQVREFLLIADRDKRALAS